MKLEYAGQIDRGRVREENQDAAILLPQYGFFAVSDGMGGLKYGGETSRFLVRWLGRIIPQDVKQLHKVPEAYRMQAAQEGLRQHIRQLNDVIYQHGNARGRAVFGATLAVAWVIGQEVLFANVGDSRSYQLTQQGMFQRSEDHNVAALLVEMGRLTTQQARHHYTASQLTQFIGCAPDELFPAMQICPAPPDSRILLCSDGLYGMLEEIRIQKLLQQGSPQECCNALIAAANEAGGQDNIAAVVAACHEGESQAAPPILLWEQAL